MNIVSIGYNSVYDSAYSFNAAPQNGVFLLMLTRSRARIEGVSVPADTLIVYDDKSVRSYSADGCPLVCDWVCFDLSGEPETADLSDIALCKPMLCSDPAFVRTMLRSAAEEFYSLGSRRSKMLDSLMWTLLIHLIEDTKLCDIPVQTADPHYSVLFELREKIYRTPQLKWNVDSMAADVNMSRSYFQHIYREVFGVSCISDVISGKIEKAKEILTGTGCTVSQVAAMCGYDNEEHFMRQFKKIVGVTPTKFRQRQG